MTFQSDLTRLEAIVADLEHNEIPLDRALALFEEGIARLRSASAQLSQAEARVQQLMEEADGTFRLHPLGG
jgi:exodeoxyribonuclease VII small subunit